MPTEVQVGERALTESSSDRKHSSAVHCASKIILQHFSCNTRSIVRFNNFKYYSKLLLDFALSGKTVLDNRVFFIQMLL